jgi:undecaprenyl-diphosphatase
MRLMLSLKNHRFNLIFNVFEIIILSLIQGITEFLPISSSSHLILFSNYINFENQSLSIDVSLHIGSFFAVLAFFYKDLINFVENKLLLLKIITSSLPTIFTGYILVTFNFIEEIRNIETIAFATIFFAFLLYFSDKCKLEKNVNKDYSLKSALIIGLLQILSLVPGVSRSGITITAARFLNFKREDSAKISFLLSLPILAAVSFYGLSEIIFTKDLFFTKLNIFAILLSFSFSYLTIKYFLIYIKKFNLNIFIYYRVLLGLVLLGIIYL